MSQLTIELSTEDQTEALGRQLAAELTAPVTIYLTGDLGVGKTRLSRAILHGLGHAGTVKSPTYTIVEPYEFAQFTIYHFDLYRLTDPSELEFMGIRDYFSGSTIVLIEWPENGQGFVNDADLIIQLSFANTGRHCQLMAKSEVGIKLLEQLNQNL